MVMRSDLGLGSYPGCRPKTAVCLWGCGEECGVQGLRQRTNEFCFRPAEPEVLVPPEESGLCSTFIKYQLCVLCNSPATTREWTFALFYGTSIIWTLKNIMLTFCVIFCLFHSIWLLVTRPGEGQHHGLTGQFPYARANRSTVLAR